MTQHPAIAADKERQRAILAKKDSAETSDHVVHLTGCEVTKVTDEIDSREYFQITLTVSNKTGAWMIRVSGADLSGYEGFERVRARVLEQHGRFLAFPEFPKNSVDVAQSWLSQQWREAVAKAYAATLEIPF